MPWNLNSDKPIYLQLVEILQTEIVSGNYSAGAKLPSVRDLATQAKVNPNTMQKALTELERTNLIVTQRTSGRFVTDDPLIIEDHKRTIAFLYIDSFLMNMKKLGYDKTQIISLIKESEANFT